MQFTVPQSFKVVFLLASLAMLASCGLPRSGPTKGEVLSASVEEEGNAFVVKVTPAVTRATAVQPTFGFSSAFKEASLIGSDTLAAGDRLNILS